MTSSTAAAVKTSTSLSSTPATPALSLPPYNNYGLHTHPVKRRRGVTGAGVTHQYPRHLLAYSLISILVILCWLPDLIVALKDVSVTIPQAVKRGSNAMLTCNYDMENDTLYSVKWYKGRREFYRYTPKENPAMKVFLTQSGLNVERNLSNQSHVVLLAVPLNISGKFTCEISVDAPSFQTAMVSGEMEVVELPEEQASVTGIQPRYRIGDLVDGNCSIKYSKPAANLTWTINGIVVPPHHIKTYQIEKYEETNLESVMSAIHFMVTTQHFIKGQMRLKCTASIFDIFKEEIESIIEEDRPRIMASGRSYDAHSYPHDNSEGYEDHNESYLTYFSAPKSSAPSMARPPFYGELQKFHKLLLQNLPATLSMWSNIKNRITFTLTTFIIDVERYYEKITQNDMTTDCMKLLQHHQQELIKLITVMAILLGIHQHKRECQLDAMAAKKNLQRAMPNNEMKQGREKEFCNSNGNTTATTSYTWAMSSCQEMQQQQQQQLHVLHDVKRATNQCYHCEPPIKARYTNDDDDTDTTNVAAAADDCQHLTANQNAINENTTITAAAVRGVTTETAAAMASSLSTTFSDCHHNYMSQTLECITATPKAFAPLAVLCMAFSSRKTCANVSFPLCCENAFNVTKSNNANYMSKDQILLMTSNTICSIANAPNRQGQHIISTCSTTSNPYALKYATSSRFREVTLQQKTPTLSSMPAPSPVPVPSISKTSPSSSLSTTSLRPSTLISSQGFSRFSLSNNCLMAFTADLLLHQC